MAEARDPVQPVRSVITLSARRTFSSSPTSGKTSGVSHTVHPALRGLVRAVRSYDYGGLPAGVHYGLPSTSLTLIVTVDEPLQVAHGGAPHRFGVLVSGLHTSPAVIGHDGSMRGVQLDLAPLAARALFGVPAGEISEGSFELQEVARQTARLIERHLDQTMSRSSSCQTSLDDAAGARYGPDFWQEMADGVQQALLGPLREHSTAPELVAATRQIERAHGALSITDLGRQMGWSDRHLSARFRGELGVTPKTLARIARFTRASTLVSEGRPLASVAAECGYADQSHMTRDFTQFAGASPRRWMDEDIFMTGSDSFNTV